MVGDIRNESPDIALSSVKLMFLRILPFGANAYTKSLRRLMDSVSDQAFRQYSPYFAGMVKLTKRQSKQFRNSSRETDFVLQEFPRLKQHRGATLEVVKAHRQKHKLNGEIKLRSPSMNLLSSVGKLDKLTLQEVTTKGARFFSSQLNPLTSKDKTDKLLNEFLESMSDAGFVRLAPILVEQLQLSKERAEKFESSEAQVDAYIKRRPRMEVCRDMIVERMKEFRQKCKLPV